MKTELHDGSWHLQITHMHGTLRRYSGQDASQAWTDKVPYDAVASVSVEEDVATLSAMLVRGTELKRDDYSSLHRLLSQLGANKAVTLRARDGRLKAMEYKV